MPEITDKKLKQYITNLRQQKAKSSIKKKIARLEKQLKPWYRRLFWWA